MSNLLVFEEYAEGGRPIWRTFGKKPAQLCFYGERQWGEEPDGLYKDEKKAALLAYSKPWLAWDFGPGSCGEYALYEPRKEVDLNGLCKYAFRQGNLAVISPMEITQERLRELTQIRENELRPLAYLTRTDPCEVANVPWLCLLCLYRYHTTCCIFSAQCRELLDEVANAGQGLKHFQVTPLKQALAWEQDTWERIYRQFDPNEPRQPLSPEAKEAMRQWREFGEEMTRRAEAQRESKQQGRRRGRRKS